MDCYQITSGSSDDVGALPAAGVCEQATGARPDPNAPAGSVPGSADASVAPTEQPPDGGPRPGADGQRGPLPPLPPVGRTIVPPAGTDGSAQDQTGSQPPSGSDSTIDIPLPLPGVSLPPLLPGLPGISIGK